MDRYQERLLRSDKNKRCSTRGVTSTSLPFLFVPDLSQRCSNYCRNYQILVNRLFIDLTSYPDIYLFDGGLHDISEQSIFLGNGEYVLTSGGRRRGKRQKAGEIPYLRTHCGCDFLSRKNSTGAALLPTAAF